MRRATTTTAGLCLLMICSGVLMAQTDQTKVDTRIWSKSYLKKMVEAGLLAPQPVVQVADAVYTSDKINSEMVLVDDSPDVAITDATNTTQSENSIFVSPLDNDVVLNSNNSTSNPVAGVFGTSGFTTMDGGLTWTGSIQGTGGSNSGDPAAGIDLNGRFFVGYIADDGGQGVARSTDMGATWTHSQVASGAGVDLLDKNHMWVDVSPSSPHAGNVYSAWTRFDAGHPNDSDIEFARSTDGGVTWSAAVNVSSAVASGSHDQGVNIQTGPNGEVYVIWAIYDSWPSDENAMGFAVSTDGGATFSPATRIITNIRGIRTTETSKNMRVASFPSMAADISGGPRNGDLFVVWPNVGVPGVNTGPDIDVYMIRSTDGGASWSSPSRVNQNPFGLGKEHYHSWLTCDPETGALSAVFYGDRNVSSSQCETFAANSLDGGATWEDFKISDVAFTPSPIPGLAGGYFGDYLGISARGAKVYPVWTDNRTGTALAYTSPFTLADPTDPNVPFGVDSYSDYTTPSSIELSWTDPDSKVNGDTLTNFGIEIWRDGDSLTFVASGVETYIDNNSAVDGTGLNDGQLYEYSLFTRDLDTDSLSIAVNTSAYSGGAPTSDGPVSFFITTSSNDLVMHWTNPVTQMDGTPLDDFAGIKLYEDGIEVMSYARSNSDTGAVDSAVYTPPAGTHSYYVTAFDDEIPSNESAASNTAFSPIDIPFFDDFPIAGDPNAGFWLNSGGVVNASASNPPSAPNALNLDGEGDVVELLPVDMSSLSDSGIVLQYFWQPQGNGELPDAGDSLIVEFKNDLGQWRQVRGYDGQAVQPFEAVLVAVSAENPGAGTFFHPAFSIRFRSVGSGAGFDDYFVDDVFLGPADNDPEMVTSTNAIGDTVLVGEVAMQSFTLSNDENQPSILDFTITESPDVAWLSVNPASGSLASLSSEDIMVTMDGGISGSGTHNTQLIIAGNDPANVSDTVDVTFVVNEAPVVGVTTDSVHFELFVDEMDSVVFHVVNTGLGPLDFSLDNVDLGGAALPAGGVKQAQKPSRTEPKGYDTETINPPVTEGEGGPDPFGYRWIDSDEPDGPTYSFTDISGTGTAVTLLPTGTFDPKDEGQATINLPFDVNYYGNSYNQVQVNSNGFITFDMSFFANAFTNTGIPSSADPNGIVCAFWDDLDGRGLNGDIYYEQIGNRFIIQWHDWGHFSSGTQDLEFQIILFNNSSTIHLVYDNMDLAQTDATVGIENLDGTIGLEIALDAAYVHSGLLTRISRSADWLTMAPMSGTVVPGDSMAIQLTADASGLVMGDYLAQVVVNSNDPLNGALESPVVSLAVTDSLVGIGDGITGLPTVYALHQNYPNPFNPTTTIRYDLPQDTRVKVSIYNLLGQEIRTLVSGTQAAGFRSITWDGKNNFGSTVSSGIYVYRIQAGDFVKSKKLMFLK